MKNCVDEIRYSKSAQKYIKSCTPSEKEHLRNAIYELRKLPPQGDIKPLQGYSDGRKRLRVGKVRIIFRYDEDGTLLILSILDIGNRGDVYK